MNIVVHCKNIDWDTDGQKVKLPKKCDVKLDLDTDIPLMANCTLTECIEDYIYNDANIADMLSDEYDFCVNGLDCTWEYDFDDVKEMFMKMAKKKHSSYCKKNKSDMKFEDWLRINCI